MLLVRHIDKMCRDAIQYHLLKIFSFDLTQFSLSVKFAKTICELPCGDILTEVSSRNKYLYCSLGWSQQ